MFNRILALTGRYWILFKKSPPRMIDLAFWPTIQMTIWGFVSIYLSQITGDNGGLVAALLSGVLLADVLTRSQLGFSMSFMEEIYSHNMFHLMASPVRPREMICSWCLVAFIRTIIGVVPAILLCIAFFDFSILVLGLSIVAFWINLTVLGWAIALIVTGLIVRYGVGAANLAYIFVFILSPVSGIYYPISVLPDWLQHVAQFIPSSHVFEGMRDVVYGTGFSGERLMKAVILNVVYMAVGTTFFIMMLNVAKKRGLLLSRSE